MEGLLNFDFTVLNWIQEHMRCGFLDFVSKGFGLAGHAGICWIVAAIVLLFFKKTRSAGIIALAAMAFGWILGDFVLKPLVQRSRPFTMDNPLNMFWQKDLPGGKPTGYSFPSGHSCAASAFTTVMLMVKRRAGFIALPFAVLMLFSRLYNYVHFPTDVFAGMILGVLSAVLMVMIFRKTGLKGRPDAKR